MNDSDAIFCFADVHFGIQYFRLILFKEALLFQGTLSSTTLPRCAMSLNLSLLLLPKARVKKQGYQENIVF